MHPLPSMDEVGREHGHQQPGHDEVPPASVVDERVFQHNPDHGDPNDKGDRYEAFVAVPRDVPCAWRRPLRSG